MDQNNQNPNNTNSNPPRTTPPVRPSGEGSVGPVVGTIIVLAVIVLGGLYFWGEHSNATAPAYTTPTASTTDDMNATTTPSTDVNAGAGIQYQGS